MKGKHILVFYSELADYTLACLRALKESGTKITLVHWPINPEAPFQFDLTFVDRSIDRSTIDDQGLIQLIRDLNPDMILCSGWMDKGYFRACQQAPRNIIRVLTLDNHWTGGLKQRLAQLASPFTIRKAFNRAFVPGEVQKQYALKLGFQEQHIRTGFYCADVERFRQFYEQADKDRIPKRFLYLGRYVQHKGIFDMWDAFKRFRKDHSDWELWCCGTGDQYDNRVEGEGIRHFGFIQPDEMLPVLKDTGVYILPSHFEPWGVSVQEMAVAGFPLLVSDAIGAREAFVREGGNGSVFPSGDVKGIEQKMRWMASLSEDELKHMATSSHETGMQHTPAKWVEKLRSFVN